jgi:hypothetical protein
MAAPWSEGQFRAVNPVRGSVLSLTIVEPNKPDRLDVPDRPNRPDSRPASRNGSRHHILLIQMNAGFLVALRLQGTQKVKNVLLLIVPERIEVPDDCVRFRGVAGKETPALVCANRLPQIRGSSVMQEEKPLSQSPQRGGAKFPGARLSLRDSIGQPWAHVMDQQVGEEIHRLVAQRSDCSIAGVERGRMAERAPGIAEQASASCD